MKVGTFSISLAAAVGAVAVDDFVNVCYYTNWAQYRPGMGKYTPNNIDPFLCTHINYAFAFVTNDGTGLRTFEWNDVTNWGTGGINFG